MRLRAFSFVLVAAALLLAGCGDSSKHLGGKANPKLFRTAVSLSPGATEILTSKAGNVKLLGRTAFCNYPVPNPTAPVVMSGVKPNYEKIAELKPEIVIYDDKLFTEADLAKFKEMGAELFAIQGDTIEEFEKCIYAFGRTFHAETMCSEYVDLIQAAAAAAKGAPPDKELKVALMMPGEGGEHMIAGVGSLQADAVRYAQGTPVGPDADRFVPISAEALVTMNPDVICVAGKAEPIQNDPRLQSISAIKKKSVYPIVPDIMLRRGARVDKLVRGLYTIFEAAARD